MTEAGELCKPNSLDRCCGGNADCFIGVGMLSPSLYCLATADCGGRCDNDAECSAGSVCFRMEAGSDCCNSTSGGVCGVPCAGPIGACGGPGQDCCLDGSCEEDRVCDAGGVCADV